MLASQFLLYAHDVGFSVRVGQQKKWRMVLFTRSGSCAQGYRKKQGNNIVRPS